MKCWDTAIGLVVIAHLPMVASLEKTTASAGRSLAEEFAMPSGVV
jgi:hypothetical protein